MKVARQSHVGISVELCVTPMDSWVALKAYQYDRHTACEWMRTHEIEHTQPTDWLHLETEKDELRHARGAPCEQPGGEQVFQRFRPIEQMHYARTWGHMFESYQRGFCFYEPFVDDKNIGARDHTNAPM